MNLPTADWANFFAAEVGASAALAGLVVVAISINLSRILGHARLPGRAAKALVTLVGAFVFASIGLVPNQPVALLGVEALVVGLVTFLVPLVIQSQSLRLDDGIPIAKKYTRLIMSLATSLPFVVAGTMLIMGSGVGLYWAATGIILSLTGGVFNAWVLLVEILR